MDFEGRAFVSTKKHSKPVCRWLPWIGLAIHLIFLLSSWPLAEGLASATRYRMAHDLEYISGEGWESDVQHSKVLLCIPIFIYAPTICVTVLIKGYANGLGRPIQWLSLLGITLGVFTLISAFYLILEMVMDFISGRLSLLLRS